MIKKRKKVRKRFGDYDFLRTFASAFKENALSLNKWCGSSAG